MDAAIRASLLGSIEAGRLVIVCGAGLSMAPPSSLPGARDVAIKCHEKYRLTADPSFDPALREDLEALAKHFFALGTLKTVFLDALVPWDDFVRPPNPGHAAIADFLICRAAAGVLTANFDNLIERQAWNYGADFQGSIDGDEATVRSHVHGPLLKFHGCAYRNRRGTVWTNLQLSEPDIATRVAKSRTWIAANLREKDLLVVGFWSDWAYLNDILGNAIQDVAPLSITLVDPSSIEDLQAKAPGLWAVAHQANVTFNHVSCSGSKVLDELRCEFSKAYFRKALDDGRAALEAEIGATCDPAWLNAPELDSEGLYTLRRDAEGVPSGAPAKRRAAAACEIFGFFHLLLRRAGAVMLSGHYRLGDRTVRLINGAGQVLSSVRTRFTEPPAIIAADIVVCVGAEDLGLPENIIRNGRPGDIIRPASSSRWVDVTRARELLNI